MLLAPCSAKLSAQSPPCSRKASPAATLRERLLQVARLAGKNQRRKASRAASRRRRAPRVRIIRHLHRSASCASFRGPTFGHVQTPGHRTISHVPPRPTVNRPGDSRQICGVIHGAVGQRHPAEFAGNSQPIPPPAGRRLARLVRMVTSSSAAVGCTAMVASKSALVALIFTAMATSWIISAAPSPDDVAADHAVGLAVDDSFMQHAWCRGPTASPCIGRNIDL